METYTSVYETFQFASIDRLRDAFRAGELTVKNVTVLLARKGFTSKQIKYVFKGWE